MCGIVGGVADRNIVPVLIEGLKRLEYRGYDSAGLAVLNRENHLQRLRTVGKVRALDEVYGWDQTLSQNTVNESQSHMGVWLHVSNQCNLRCSYCYLGKTNEQLSLALGRRGDVRKLTSLGLFA